MIQQWLWPHRYRPQVLEAEALSRLKMAVLESPYLAVSDLNEGFTGTRGFTLLFHIEEKQRAEALMPELKPFFAKALKPKANVFFLNPLVIDSGVGVAPHADKTLVSYVGPGENPPFPFCVSVLYLCIPSEKTGGQLVFHRLIGRLPRKPLENLMIEFPGWMMHEVTPLVGRVDSPPRVSLVLEQYHLSPTLKAQVPKWSLETTRPFSEFMELAEGGDEDDLPDAIS